MKHIIKLVNQKYSSKIAVRSLKSVLPVSSHAGRTHRSPGLTEGKGAGALTWLYTCSIPLTMYQKPLYKKPDLKEKRLRLMSLSFHHIRGVEEAGE